MKKGLATCLGILVGSLSVWTLGFGQIIENPAKPIAKNAGRVLGLSEVWRITDDRGDFYFRRPHDLQVAADGSIFIAEREEFLRFSSEGKFLKNIYKKGQGPGEIDDSFMYYIRGSDIYVQDSSSRRLWRADFDGVFQEQVVLKNTDSGVFIGIVPDGYLFIRMTWPPRSEWTGRLMDILHNVDLLAKDGSERKGVAMFKTKAFLRPEAATNWDSSITVLSPDGKSIYAFFGRDYLVEVVDLAGDNAAKRFRRTYPRIPHVESSWEADFRKKYGFPRIEYETDIRGLYPIDGRVWVETSTEDKAKGRLIDVFDRGGRFIDSFYLGAGRTLMAVGEECIFCQEKGDDETITIVKYKIDARTP
jgi:hypothetical protein